MADPLAKEKLAELDETMALCAGLWMDAQARQPEVIPGSHLTFTTTVLNRSTAQVTFEGGAVEGMLQRAARCQTGEAGLQPERHRGVHPGGACRPAVLAAVLAGEAAYRATIIRWTTRG